MSLSELVLSLALALQSFFPVAALKLVQFARLKGITRTCIILWVFRLRQQRKISKKTHFGVKCCFGFFFVFVFFSAKAPEA